MAERVIYVTDFDMERLRRLLEGTRLWSSRDRQYLERLEEELDRAHVVPSEEIPGDVATMNSRVKVKEPRSGRLCSGIGSGDTVEWTVPAGLRRLKISEVLYQPEAAGDFHL